MADAKLHILLIHQAFVSLNEPGGTRHYEFAQHLIEKGHTVTVITSGISYLTGRKAGKEIPGSKENGLKILRAPTLGALHRSFLFRLINFFSFTISSFFIGLGVGKVNVVWGTSPPIFQAVTAWLLARLKGAAFLFEVRDLWPAFAVAVGVLRNGLLISASEGLERFLYKHADRILLNSPGFLEHVKARGGKQIEIVPNGADASMFDPQSDGREFRTHYGLPDKFLVLYAGAHGISNDLPIVLQAAELLKNDENIVFALLGDGKEKPALQKLAQEMKLENVVFIPPLPKTEMLAALAAADACLAILKPLKLYATVYPNKVFDYMAAGRPILLAIDGPIREVIGKAKAGIFVQPGNPAALAEAIRELAADQQKARKMGLAGRKYLEQYFNRKELAAQLEQVIVETAAGKLPAQL